MHPHRFGFALRTQFSATVLEVADQFLLLGIHRNDRLPSALEGLHLRIDVLELGVPIRVRRPLAGLAVGLQAVAQLFQQICHQFVADLVALVVEFVSQFTHALAGPAQWRFRIATTQRFNQLLQVVQQGRVLGDRPLAPAAGAADPHGRGGVWRSQFLKTIGDGLPRDTRRTGHRRDAAITQGLGFSGRIQPPQSFVQIRFKPGKTLLDEVSVHAGQYTINALNAQPDALIS